MDRRSFVSLVAAAAVAFKVSAADESAQLPPHLLYACLIDIADGISAGEGVSTLCGHELKRVQYHGLDGTVEQRWTLPYTHWNDAQLNAFKYRDRFVSVSFQSSNTRALYYKQIDSLFERLEFADHPDPRALAEMRLRCPVVHAKTLITSFTPVKAGVVVDSEAPEARMISWSDSKVCVALPVIDNGRKYNLPVEIAMHHGFYDRIAVKQRVAGLLLGRG